MSIFLLTLDGFTINNNILYLLLGVLFTIVFFIRRELRLSKRNLSKESRKELAERSGNTYLRTIIRVLLWPIYLFSEVKKIIHIRYWRHKNK
jgi:hypothetical protein